MRAPETVTEQLTLAGTEFVATLTLRSRLGVLALHGGREGGTAELAEETASRTGATCLTFTQPVGTPVHIPSHRLSGAPSQTLGLFLRRVTLTVSLHGHLRPAAPYGIFLGGTNRVAAEILAGALAALPPPFDPVTELALIPEGLKGLHPRNPVNMTSDGGVQVELPLTARTRNPGRLPGIPGTPPREIADALTAGLGRL